LAGRKTHCEKRSVLGIKNRDGAFAEYVCLPLVNLIAVPDTVSDDAAVFVEPLAAALEIQAQIPITSQDNVLILGAGQLGQLIAQSLVTTDCNLSVAARYEKQRNILIKHDIHRLDESVISNSLFDIVIEATGSPNGFLLAQQSVRPRGTIVLKSTYTDRLPLNLSPIVVNEISIIGSRCGPFTTAIDLINCGQVNPTDLIEGRYALHDVRKAFDLAAGPGTLKVILETK
jgi:threonine dehydrogenase-like Zn-dependent dehydrogenase